MIMFLGCITSGLFVECGYVYKINGDQYDNGWFFYDLFFLFDSYGYSNYFKKKKFSFWFMMHEAVK